ncbi:MAG: hypothetical protein EOM67_02020 [Spirochaetia bacterium]|nr:hypothetical protein [Spirochaetia bacterium]
MRRSLKERGRGSSKFDEHSSLRKGNGKMLCSRCLREQMNSFSRKRSIKYTAEDDPVAETIIVVVGHLLRFTYLM